MLNNLKLHGIFSFLMCLSAVQLGRWPSDPTPLGWRGVKLRSNSNLSKNGIWPLFDPWESQGVGLEGHLLNSIALDHGIRTVFTIMVTNCRTNDYSSSSSCSRTFGPDERVVCTLTYLLFHLTGPSRDAYTAHVLRFWHKLFYSTSRLWLS